MKATKTEGKNGIVDVALDREHVLPCPFCGGKAELNHTWTASYWMECVDCGAEAPGNYTGGDRSKREHLRAAKSALDTWNRRF